MQNVSSDAPASRARKSKSSNKLKVSCLKEWLKDHKAFKPKPSILPNNVNDLAEKFTLKTHYKKR